MLTHDSLAGQPVKDREEKRLDTMLRTFREILPFASQLGGFKDNDKLLNKIEEWRAVDDLPEHIHNLKRELEKSRSLLVHVRFDHIPGMQEHGLVFIRGIRGPC